MQHLLEQQQGAGQLLEARLKDKEVEAKKLAIELQQAQQMLQKKEAHAAEQAQAAEEARQKAVRLAAEAREAQLHSQHVTAEREAAIGEL